MTSSASSSPLRIEIIAFDGVDELDIIGPLEVFRSAQTMGADLSARIVTRLPQHDVTGSFGLRFQPDAVYAPGQADVLVVPGGQWVARGDIGVWGEVKRGEWLPELADAAAAGIVLAGVCTGTMMLAHAGVVGHRRATTHHAAWDDLAATGATLVRERVVDDGDLITCGGVTSGLDLALRLVEREFSTDLAERVALRLEYPALQTLAQVTR